MIGVHWQDPAVHEEEEEEEEEEETEEELGDRNGASDWSRVKQHVPHNVSFVQVQDEEDDAEDDEEDDEEAGIKTEEENGKKEEG